MALENSANEPGPWGAVVAAVREWAETHAIELRDTVVLLPYAQLLPNARSAFALAGGWSPRVETTLTLAASLGPEAVFEPGQISFDAALDALSAAQLLRSQRWGTAWSLRDPRGFAQAVDQVVGAAQDMARAAAAVAPASRGAHWAASLDLMPPLTGPGASARLLARVALEWARMAPAPATDRLFGLTPAAWVVVQAGGPDALACRLLHDAPTPGLLIDCDPPADQPLFLPEVSSVPAVAVCSSFEDEASCTAAQVLEHLRLGQTPVALIAQDRRLVRRVRALLERQQIELLDETGWTLSTTHAAARLMALLEASRADARIDALFDWLHAGTHWSAQTAELVHLETVCRRHNITRIAHLDTFERDAPVATLWSSVRGVLRDLAAPSRQSLRAWSGGLADALRRCGAMPWLAADEAGRQVIVALRLDAPASGAWATIAGGFAMDFDEFVAWVDRVLEQQSFRPANEAAAQVVITPLQRVMLRPFAALVFPGADDKHLGARAAPHALLGDALLGALGLPDAAQRQHGESIAFSHALRNAAVTFLRRRNDGAEPLSASPLLERLALALAQGGRGLAVWRDPGHDHAIAATPIRRSAPPAPALLPQRLSASACETLRACPYRFFALHVLRLREDDELEGEVDKRDYGNWLHAVLHAFHRARSGPAAPGVELADLHRFAVASQQEHALDDAEFLPFAASFAAFAPRYVAWLHERDTQGAHWQRGEASFETTPAELRGLALYGIVDRIDEVRVDGADALELIDYKTGNASGLHARVRQPLEDTQLAFYAALAGAGNTLPLQAMYLAVDGTHAIEEALHPHVASSAAALLQGLAHDIGRLREGAGMAALGEGATCDFCVARGVCRRDQWSADEGQGT